MKESFLYIQCNLVCYIAIEKYGLADEKKYELADDIAKSFRSTELSRQDVSEESSGGRVRARARRNLFGDQSRAVQAEQSGAEQNRAEHRWTGLVGRSRVETGSRPNLAAVVVQYVFVAKCFRSY